MFAYQDLADAGILVGSRVPSTGTAMFSFNRLSAVDEARALLARYRDHYRTRNVKQYLIGNRQQRQWLAQAAKDVGVMPTTEGSLSLKLDLSQIMDGYWGGAQAIGRADEFGSIESGKFADLVVLNADPRDDIRRSRDIELVMKNGRLYDASTLDDSGRASVRSSSPGLAATARPSTSDGGRMSR